MGNDKIISVRFTQKCIALLNKISKKRGIKPAKLIQIITNDYIEIFDKCFVRRDLIVQRAEFRELYEKIPKDELDAWIEKTFSKAISCMKLFAPIFEFQEMTDTWMKFYEINSYHLEYDDDNGWRKFHCITDMGYNWCYVYGNVYYKIFESKWFKMDEFVVHNEGFSFKVKIPVDDDEKN